MARIITPKYFRRSITPLKNLTDQEISGTKDPFVVGLPYITTAATELQLRQTFQSANRLPNAAKTAVKNYQE